MKKSPTVLRAGTRPSSLALTQTRNALDRIEAMLDGIVFEMVQITSVGDTDRSTDLRESPENFFTKELDEALLRGDVDMAVHSAKDVPYPVADGIDWFWLPWREEPRDVLILAPGRKVSDLPDNPVIGVSSDRREAYCNIKFPNGIQKTIRGNIEERIAQVDNGDFDVVIMAGAALNRLNLRDRITEWIPLDQLEVPEAQGYLAITFRVGDERLMALRSLFMHAVVFAGAGVSSRDLCTVAALRALKQCDVCLYDSLIDKSLLDELPPGVEAIDVGKRCGAHSREQHETTKLICECVRQSKKVLRLKGGDPGIFGRLAEETAALEKLDIPFRVIPGISALQAATTGTGMLLTRRDVSRGFVALTPRMPGGGLAKCDAEMKEQLPVIYYMSIRAIDRVSSQMLENGHAPETPAALIFNAGGENEEIIRMKLGELASYAKDHCTRQPGLIMVGDITKYAYKTKLGALQGYRLLITCSDSIQHKAGDLALELGGRPIHLPLIRLECRQSVQLDLAPYDWLVATSPSSVRALMKLIYDQKVDYRTIPRIMVCGRGTASKFAEYGIRVDAQPDEGFSAESLIALSREVITPGEKILRVRSDKAGPELADALRSSGADVDDTIIYDNIRVEYEELPSFDAVFFASASGVESLIAQWGVEALQGKVSVVIGKPTADALERHGIKPDVVAKESTIPHAVESLAEYLVSRRIAAEC
jgi:uroporphyrinogen III methyltransferase/synthase